MWVFENVTGKRTEATEENARGMIAEGGGFSVLWPKGTPEEEAFEFEALRKDAADGLGDGAAIMRTQHPRQTAATPVAEPVAGRRTSFVKRQDE